MHCKTHGLKLLSLMPVVAPFRSFGQDLPGLKERPGNRVDIEAMWQVLTEFRFLGEMVLLSLLRMYIRVRRHARLK